jgi:hypothetical protein
VKTFVLCLGAGLGLMMVLDKISEAWVAQSHSCDETFVHGKNGEYPCTSTCMHLSVWHWHFACHGDGDKEVAATAAIEK